MRDLFVTLVVFGSLPLVLRKPFFGILVSVWLGLMNPHRLCWGFAAGMPFALIVAATLIIGFMISKEPKRLPASPLTGLLAFWWFWLFVTTLTAFYPEISWEQWGKVWRIMLLTFLTLIMLTSRERLHALIWVCAVSLGFYGVKGGIFTVLGGGDNHVWGPVGTFIGGNNEVGLALIMTVPLMRYLQMQSRNRWVRIGLGVAMVLTIFAILGTQSRGALLGLAAMALYLVVKSRNRAGLLVLLTLAIPVALLMMPESWHDRMSSIGEYQQDASAMGRINAWWTAWYLALDHPFVGGGFDCFRRGTFAQYAPNPEDVHDIHSIYFQALGSHGFVGLFTFLAILFVTLRTLNRVLRFARRSPEFDWMRDLASMVFVSIIGYAVSGAFLGLAMFDFFYTLVAVTIGLDSLVRRLSADAIPGTPAAAKAVAPSLPGGRPKVATPRGPRVWVAMTDWYAKL